MHKEQIIEYDTSNIRADRFFDTPPFHFSKFYAEKYNCDLAVPNGCGIGNVICFTRLIEEYALNLGRPIKLLTAPLNPSSGIEDREGPFPIWNNNPFIEQIINSDNYNHKIIKDVNREQDNYCQFNHIIENICSTYGLRPRKLRPSLFLSIEEMKWAINFLKGLKRPIIALHPTGKSSSISHSKWFIDRWLELIDELNDDVSFIQLGKKDFDSKPLPIMTEATTLRETMALIWAADLFIGFDSSLAHIATAFEKPSLVLWDVVRKTPIEEIKHTGFGGAATMRWGYPQNRNVMLLGEKDKEIFHLMIEFINEKLTSFKRKY